MFHASGERACMRAASSPRIMRCSSEKMFVVAHARALLMIERGRYTFYFFPGSARGPKHLVTRPRPLPLPYPTATSGAPKYIVYHKTPLPGREPNQLTRKICPTPAATRRQRTGCVRPAATLLLASVSTETCRCQPTFAQTPGRILAYHGNLDGYKNI